MEDEGEKQAKSVGRDKECDTDTSEPSSEAEDFRRLTQELTEAVERCRDKTLKELERLKLQTQSNYTAAREQITASIANLRSLLDEKEKELCQELDQMRRRKMEALNEREDAFTEVIGQAAELLTGSETAVQDLLCRGSVLLSSLSSPISPHHSHTTAHPGLGFCSEMSEHMAQALSLGMWVCGENVRVGERCGVTAVGGLQTDGSFWVRKILADPLRQEYSLQHISNALYAVPQLFDPLTECAPGQLCVAQFSQDGRYYRAVIVDTPKPGMAKFFFLDHGGSEEAAVSSLYPLPDHFRALPFQMIHVKITDDLSVDFNTREMRWCFTDHTHKKVLVADILSQCDIDLAGPLYLIHLEDHTQAEPFDVGRILVTAAKVKEPRSKFNSQDIRYKDKGPPPSVQATPTAVDTATKPAPPPPEADPAPLANSTAPAPTSGEGGGVELSTHPHTVNSHAVPTTSTLPAATMATTSTLSAATMATTSTLSAATMATTSTLPAAAMATVPTTSTLPAAASAAASVDGLSDSAVQAGSVPSPNSPSPTPHSTHSPVSHGTHSPVSQLQTTQSALSLESQSAPSSQSPPVAQNSLDSHDTMSPGSPPSPSHPHTAVKSFPESGLVSSDTAPDVTSTTSPPARTNPALTLKPLQLSETEGVLLSNEILPATDDITSDDGINSLHPSVVTGARLSVEVDTELTSDGHFWCQLHLPSSEGEGDRPLDELRVATAREEGEPFTPVFYNEGDLCAAQFSEDGRWYRARIERVIPGVPHASFIVRYLDFGNCEAGQQHQLMVLGSEFMLRPPNAIHCTIATTDHTTFTSLECEKFEELTSQDGIFVEVLSVPEAWTVLKVKVWQTLPDNKDVDITEAIYSFSDEKSSVKVMASRLWSSSNDMEAGLEAAHVSDWASHMEDQTEEDIVFLTLPGHESSREATPSFRETTPTNQREVTPVRSQREATPTRPDTTTPHEESSKGATPTPTNQRETTPIITETTPTNQREDTTEAPPITRVVSPAKQREATPTTRREASPITRTSNAPTPREATPTQQEAPPTQQDAGPSQWAPLKTTGSFLQRVATSNHNHPQSSSGRQARLDVSRARHTIISSLGAKNLPRSLHPEDSGVSRGSSRTRHSKPDQKKVYVKGMPLEKADSEIRELFGRYGDVIEIDPHTTDPTKLYVVMDAKGADEVVANMNGYQVAPGHKLVVERYRVRSPSPPPLLPTPTPHGADVPPSTEQVRLFVKNISTDHTPGSLKTVFSRYGRVWSVVPDPKRRNVAYVYMDVEGGAKAISNLHGKTISKNGKPLIVELSYEPKNR